MAAPEGELSPGCLRERCHCLYTSSLWLSVHVAAVTYGTIFYCRDTRGPAREMGLRQGVLWTEAFHCIHYQYQDGHISIRAPAVLYAARNRYFWLIHECLSYKKAEKLHWTKIHVTLVGICIRPMVNHKSGYILVTFLFWFLILRAIFVFSFLGR